MAQYDILSILQSKPHNRHYLDRYYNFIISCLKINKGIDSSIYIENHHICPKANDLFPEYKNLISNEWNRIKLTAKQHYIAHHLLWKSYSWSSMSYTFKCFVDGYKTKSHKRSLMRITSKKYSLLKEQNSIYRKTKLVGMVSAKDKTSGKNYFITKLAFDSDCNMVGHAYGNKHYKSEQTKTRMRKPKEKDHADKIRNNVNKLSTIPFVCCVVSKKVYTQNTWVTYYKILYEQGFLEKFGNAVSKALSGIKKTEAHKNALSVSKKLKSSIERICDIKTQRETTTASFKKMLTKEKSDSLIGRVCEIKTRKEYDLPNFSRWVLSR